MYQRAGGENERAGGAKNEKSISEAARILDRWKYYKRQAHTMQIYTVKVQLKCSKFIAKCGRSMYIGKSCISGSGCNCIIGLEPTKLRVFLNQQKIPKTFTKIVLGW